MAISPLPSCCDTCEADTVRLHRDVDVDLEARSEECTKHLGAVGRDDHDPLKHFRGISEPRRFLAAGLLMVTGVIDYDRLGPAMRAAYDHASNQ